MNLIIISGATSTGKSTLARKLSRDLNVHSFLRDEFKEKHFDNHGGRPTLRQLAKIEAASYRELEQQIILATESNKDLIIESNFLYKERGKLQRLINQKTNVIEVFCYATGRTIFKRYTARYRSSERHRGHRDYLWYPIVAYESLGPMNKRYKPLKLSKHTKMVYTEDFSSVNYKEILKYVRNSQP
jgi:shikimate kinase